MAAAGASLSDPVAAAVAAAATAAASAAAPLQAAAIIEPTITGELGATAITALWVPVVVFAHVFAAFWLLKTWLLNSPSLQRKAAAPVRVAVLLAKSASQRVAARMSKGGAGRGTPRGSADDVVAACDGDQVVVRVTAVLRPPGPNDTAACMGANLCGGAAAEGLASREKGADGGASDDSSAAARPAAADRAPAAPSLSVAPIALEWRGVGCSYSTPAGPRDVLKDVWGGASPGKMQALLGPSGAGKSTLMDILAMRKSVGSLTGRLLVNGARAGKQFIKMTAYVPQEDSFVPTMTSWEIMAFYADIILPVAWPPARRRVRIREVLAEVGLAHAHRTIAGGTLPGGLMMRGLSGGERKRLSIAVGILAAPSVVFLDEPTSGLDSFAALTVMGYLKRMALQQGQVVIASIHQPRSAIWQMFDAVTLLASGRLMYHGPRDGLTVWFASLGYAYNPALHGVPSDWALDLVAIGFAKPEQFYGNTISTREELLSASAAFKAHYLEVSGLTGDEASSPRRAPGSPRRCGPRAAAACGAGAHASDSSGMRVTGSFGDLASAMSSSNGGAPASAGGAAVTSTGGDDRVAAAGGLRQARTLLGRELLSITRNPSDVAGRTLTFCWVGVLIGILYYGTPFDAASARTRLNLLYTLLSFYCLMPYVTMGLYAADKKFYLSDSSSQLYSPWAYYVAKVCAITPFQVVSALVFGFTVYGMAGLRPGAAAVLKNGAVGTLMYLIASQVLHCCAIIAPNQDVAFMLSIMWTTIQLLLSGFFVNFKEVFNGWITYLRFISATYYSLEAAAINEFDSVYLACGRGAGPAEVEFAKLAFPNTTPAAAGQLERLFKQAPGGACVLDARAVLRYFDFSRPFWASAALLGGYLAVCHALTFAAMLVAARRERR